MEITVAFTYPKKFKVGAKFISLYINRPYSHVCIYWKSAKLDRTLVYHAAHGKVHFLELNNLLKENNIIKTHTIKVTEDEYNFLIQKCVDLAGQNYSFLGLLVLGARDVLSRLKIKTELKDTKGYFCSELMACLLKIVFNKPFSFRDLS